MHRLIVTSSVYRQSSQASEESWQRDPQNLWLTRSPRFRVSAETVRDLALSAAGLLSTKAGGPSVFPPQPASVTDSTFVAFEWNTATDENRYRRGLYTFTKRTIPYAAFVTFDAPSREVCTVRRERSNTPLQALTLLNDTVFVEASQALARRLLSGPRHTTHDRLVQLFCLVLTRPPTVRECEMMQQFLTEQIERFRGGELNAMVAAGATLKRWQFNSSSALSAAAQACRAETGDGVLRIICSDDDAHVTLPVTGPPGPLVLTFRARFGSAHAGRVSWLTADDPEPQPANSAAFETKADKWQHYSVDVQPTSELTAICLELGDGATELEVDWMDLSYSRVPQINTELSELAGWTALARVVLNLDMTITRE